jgi:hypothetical protein
MTKPNTPIAEVSGHLRPTVPPRAAVTNMDFSQLILRA